MRKLFITGIIFITGLGSLQAQEIQFSQYFSTALYLNPAFSAIYVDPSFFVTYRRPTTSGQNAYTESNQVSASFPLFDDNPDNIPQAGLGLMAYNNKFGPQGVQKIMGVMANYAHNISIGSLNTEVIALGVQVGYENYRVSYSELQAPSQYNPYYGSGFDEQLAGLTGFDDMTAHAIVNLGAMYYYNRERNFNIYNYSAFSGIAVTNVNRPNTSAFDDGESRAAMLFKYHGGFEFKINRSNILPHLLIQTQQGSFSTDAGIYLWYAIKENMMGTGPNIKMLAGASYRIRDSFIFLAGVNVNNISVKASYDLNSDLIFEEKLDYSKNNFELSLQYTIRRQGVARKFSNPLF